MLISQNNFLKIANECFKMMGECLLNYTKYKDLYFFTMVQHHLIFNSTMETFLQEFLENLGEVFHSVQSIVTVLSFNGLRRFFG